MVWLGRSCERSQLQHAWSCRRRCCKVLNGQHHDIRTLKNSNLVPMSLCLCEILSISKKPSELGNGSVSASWKYCKISVMCACVLWTFWNEQLRMRNSCVNLSAPENHNCRPHVRFLAFSKEKKLFLCVCVSRISEHIKTKALRNSVMAARKLCARIRTVQGNVTWFLLPSKQETRQFLMESTCAAKGTQTRIMLEATRPLSYRTSLSCHSFSWMFYHYSYSYPMDGRTRAVDFNDRG